MQKGGYNKRRVFSRRFKQGKGKGKGSQRKRPGFRPRSQKKGKGYLADDQVPDDQAFYGKKGKKGGKKGGKKQKTLLRVRKRERIRRATPAHLLAKRTWPILLPPKSTSMLRKPLPLGKMHGRKIIIGTPITDAESILSNGITSMSRGTILYMTVGTYGLAYNAMESPQIFQSLA